MKEANVQLGWRYRSSVYEPQNVPRLPSNAVCRR